MSNFAENIEKAEKQAQQDGHAMAGGSWFKFQEGDNRVRVLEEPVLIFEKYKVGICYTECNYEGAPRFMAHVLDKRDGIVKLAKFPYKIGTTIAAYQTDEDYAFSEFPMPFDIKIHAKNAGTKEVEYTITPSPKREDVPSEAKELMAKNKPVADIIQKMKENQKQKHIDDGSFQARQEEKNSLKDEIASARAGDGLPEIEYPADEISPNDIPF